MLNKKKKKNEKWGDTSKDACANEHLFEFDWL